MDMAEFDSEIWSLIFFEKQIEASGWVLLKEAFTVTVWKRMIFLSSTRIPWHEHFLLVYVVGGEIR